MQGLKLNNVSNRGPWSAPVARMQRGMVVCLQSWWYIQVPHADPISHPHSWAMGCLLWIFRPPFPHPTSASVSSDAEGYGGLHSEQMVQVPHEHPISLPHGWAMGCLLWVFRPPFPHPTSASVSSDAERYGGLPPKQVVHTSATCRPHISPSWANYGDVYGEYFYLHSLSASVLQDAERYGGLALEQVVHTSATCTSHISPSRASYGMSIVNILTSIASPYLCISTQGCREIWWSCL